LQDEILPKH